jgi:hypothetical protein
MLTGVIADPTLPRHSAPSPKLERDMRIALLATALLLLFGVGFAAEKAPVPSAVVCTVRLLEGKPGGAVKELSSPTLTTLVARPADFENGGKLKASSGDLLSFGVRYHVNPKQVGAKTCEATVSLEVTEPANKEGAVVSTAGNVVRATGTFTLGKPTRIVAKELGDGKQLWAEVTFEKP